MDNDFANDTFDKLCSNLNDLKVKNKKETVDPFDLLFESSPVNPQPLKVRNKILANVEEESCFSSPNTPEYDINESRDKCALFNSFSKENIENSPLKVRATPKIRKPKSYRARNKNSSVSLLKKPQVKDPLNDTLNVKITFSKSSFDDVASAAKPSSSLLQLSPPSHCKLKSFRNLKTSTPFLGTKSRISVAGTISNILFQLNLVAIFNTHLCL